MAKDLKKFVNPKFIRTVDLVVLRRLLDRHADNLLGLDLSNFGDDPDQTRRRVQNFFAGPEENYPEGLVADLHRIAELANANGLQLLLEQARRRSVEIAPAGDDDNADETKQDPKHVALRLFLDHPGVFDAAADMLSYTTLSSFSEFAGIEEGVDAQIDEEARDAFQREAERIFEADLRGRYCRIGWYDDADELNVVVTHGAPLKTTEVIEAGADRVISFREAEHAVLSYSAVTGRLKVGGFAKARRAELAEVFATTMLKRPRFFALRTRRISTPWRRWSGLASASRSSMRSIPAFGACRSLKCKLTDSGPINDPARREPSGRMSSATGATMRWPGLGKARAASSSAPTGGSTTW